MKFGFDELQIVLSFSKANYQKTIPRPGRMDRTDPAQLVVELSRLANVQMDETTLKLCIRLLDQGVDPVSLATSIKNIEKEARGYMG